eukprot:3295882-Rhodomonas_salina.1
MAFLDARGLKEAFNPLYEQGVRGPDDLRILTRQVSCAVCACAGCALSQSPTDISAYRKQELDDLNISFVGKKKLMLLCGYQPEEPTIPTA